MCARVLTGARTWTHPDPELVPLQHLALRPKLAILCGQRSAQDRVRSILSLSNDKNLGSSQLGCVLFFGCF